MRPKGVVAAGHVQTVETAATVLRDGGNAFDAIVAAHFAACIAEPVLASLAGGGFLLARPADRDPILYDFFVQTPIEKRRESLHFYPVDADFGETTQEFHIGLGSVGTPGTVKGLFEIHRDLCSMPMPSLVQPAIELARHGVEINPLQHYILDVVKPIFLATAESQSRFGSTENPENVLPVGTRFRVPQLGDFMRELAVEGDRWFYYGAPAQQVVELCREGGHLGLEDFRRYRAFRRKPLRVQHGAATVFTNPPPSSGGLLIAFGLQMLRDLELARFPFGSRAQLELMAATMRLTCKARLDAQAKGMHSPDAERFLDPEFCRIYREEIADRAQSLHGTTHISVIDAEGNMAAMTISNGAASGQMIPGTGVMLNNMLGEEDLNPMGFQNWHENQRMTSMMSPTLMFDHAGAGFALGSGGSNRIRTAILQVLVNLIDYDMPIRDAVESPRLHIESNELNLESGFDPRQVHPLKPYFPEIRAWDRRNLFFGGTHVARHLGSEFEGAGDPRRGGCAKIVE